MALYPVGKRLPRRVFCREQQLRHPVAAAEELLGQALQRVQVVAVPLRRAVRQQRVEDPLADAPLHPLEPRAKGFPPDYPLIDAVARVESAQRSVGEIPFTSVETKTLVDHDRTVAGLRSFISGAGFPVKQSLPPIGV